MPRYISSIGDFLNRAKPKVYEERRLIGYSMDQVYAVASDVDRYQEFLPWIVRSTVTTKTMEGLSADLTIGFPPMLLTYSSNVTLKEPQLVKAVSEDNVFKHLETRWVFTPGPTEQKNACFVDFRVSFEFKNPLHAKVVGLFFDEAAGKTISAFLTRCEKLYGKPSLPSLKSSIK